jgi:hypothetical protein
VNPSGSTRTGRARVALLACALGAALGGCKFVGATDTNLRELHNEDGLHRRSARVVSHYSYATRVGIFGLLRSVGVKQQESSPTKIEDPLASCLEALQELASFDTDDPRVRALQVEHFSRIARYDPWRLSREVAVTQLGKLGTKLGEWPELPRGASETPATVEQVVAEMQKLIRAANELARGGETLAELDSVAPPTSTGDDASVDAACRGIAGLELELDGAHRALRLCSILERSRLGRDPRLAPVLKLRRQLERRCIELALHGALRDLPPNAQERQGSDPGWDKPNVKAAAVRAAVRVWGAPMLAQLLDPRTLRGDDAPRLIALMHEVERHGLPGAPLGAPLAEQERLEKEQLRVTWSLATDHPEGSVRIAALGALGKISGRGRFSLADEDWLDWARGEGLLEAASPTSNPAPPNTEAVEGPLRGAVEGGAGVERP